MSREMTNSEAIANLNHIYGVVSPDIQRSLDVAFKAIEERQTGGECMTEEEKKIKDLIEKYRCGLIDSEECISKCHLILIDKANSAKAVNV